LTAPYEKEKALRELEELFDEIIYRSWKPHGRAYNPTELKVLLAETKADALISEHDEITADVLRANPHLKFVGICRGTPSNIDLTVATELGIPVFHTPARNAQAVAEMFIANVITLMRNTMPAIRSEEHTSELQSR